MITIPPPLFIVKVEAPNDAAVAANINDNVPPIANPIPSSSSNNKRARGRPKRSSFANDLDDQTLPAAVTLLRKLDDVDFGNFESQLQPIADGMGSSQSNDNITTTEEPSTLLKECLKFLVLKKIAGDEDATMLSPTDVIDAVWHQLLLNPRLYKNINEALGGEMIDHNPEGGRDVSAYVAPSRCTSSSLSHPPPPSPVRYERLRSCHPDLHPFE